MTAIIEGGVILYIFRQIQKYKDDKDTYELLKVRKPENYSKEVLNILNLATTKKTKEITQIIQKHKRHLSVIQEKHIPMQIDVVSQRLILHLCLLLIS